MARRGLWDKVGKRVKKGVRQSMNRVMDAVGDFEEQGGIRGAAERVRVKAERHAKTVQEMLEARGIRLGMLVTQTPDYQTRLQKAYAVIGVPTDSPMNVVKSAYREKMRKHHPDKHAGDPDQERQATKISQEITIAYEVIEDHFRRVG